MFTNSTFWLCFILILIVVWLNEFYFTFLAYQKITANLGTSQNSGGRVPIRPHVQTPLTTRPRWSGRMRSGTVFRWTRTADGQKYAGRSLTDSDPPCRHFKNSAATVLLNLTEWLKTRTWFFIYFGNRCTRVLYLPAHVASCPINYLCLGDYQWCKQDQIFNQDQGQDQNNETKTKTAAYKTKTKTKVTRPRPPEVNKGTSRI